MKSDSNIEGRSGVKVCCIRGQLPALIDSRLNPTVEGLYKLRRAARALQPGGQADAKGVPAVARCFVGAQAVRQQGGQELVGMGWRERRGVISTELKVSEPLCRIARDVEIGEGNRPVAPDLTCCIAFALARGDFTPVTHCEGLQLQRRGVLCRNTSDHPEERGTREPSRSVRQISNLFGFAKATDVVEADYCKETGTKKRSLGQGGGGNEAMKVG
eukprot:2167315-Pleurochrysis_carterae.AAC.2